jgi:hypothetical protein
VLDRRTAVCFSYGMASSYRHPVGKETLSGYIVIRPQDREFFGEDPGTKGCEITLVFGEGQKIRARFYRSGGKAPKLKIAFTGKAGAPFRSYLRRKFKPRRVRGPRGYLTLTRLAADRFGVSPESLKQAMRDVLQLGSGRFFEGARARSVLHPALIDTRDLLEKVHVPSRVTPRQLCVLIARALTGGGWKEVSTVGGGLALSAGLRRQKAQLHIVLEDNDLVPALVSMAAAFHLQDINLGVVLVADRGIARRLGRTDGRSLVSLDRVVRTLRTLEFLARGPSCVYTLSVVQTLK